MSSTLHCLTYYPGQRYHVIVEANPLVESLDGNYWMRTIPAKSCSSFGIEPDVKTGIIRYDAEDTSDPTSSQNEFPTACRDEPYESLIPKLPWKVGSPANKDGIVLSQKSLRPC